MENNCINTTEQQSIINSNIITPLYRAKDHDSKFDANEYLKGFYSTHKDDGAMQMVLFFLPGILYRLPKKNETLLDLGAGPTIYIPIAVRYRVENIFTSDYSLTNIEKLVEWIENKNQFNWTNICNWIKCIESSNETPNQMQEIARKKMRVVFKVNVHDKDVIQEIIYRENKNTIIPKQFDIVTSIFCLEYASETKEEYKRAVKNAIKLIKPGGFLIQGGVLHADEYCFANVRFKSYFLTQSEVIKTLEENLMCTDEKSENFHLIVSGEVFLLFSKKLY